MLARTAGVSTRPQGRGALAKAAGLQRQDSKPPRHSGSCPTVTLSTEMESPDDRTQATSQRGTRQRNLMAHIFILSNRCNFDLFIICRVSGLPLCRLRFITQSCRSGVPRPVRLKLWFVGRWGGGVGWGATSGVELTEQPKAWCRIF